MVVMYCGVFKRRLQRERNSLVLYALEVTLFHSLDLKINTVKASGGGPWGWLPPSDRGVPVGDRPFRCCTYQDVVPVQVGLSTLCFGNGGKRCDCVSFRSAR